MESGYLDLPSEAVASGEREGSRWAPTGSRTVRGQTTLGAITQNDPGFKPSPHKSCSRPVSGGLFRGCSSRHRKRHAPRRPTKV